MPICVLLGPHVRLLNHVGPALSLHLTVVGQFYGMSLPSFFLNTVTYFLIARPYSLYLFNDGLPFSLPLFTLPSWDFLDTCVFYFLPSLFKDIFRGNSWSLSPRTHTKVIILNIWAMVFQSYFYVCGYR